MKRVFRLWEETGENPRMHEDRMQTPHRKDPAGIRTTAAVPPPSNYCNFTVKFNELIQYFKKLNTFLLLFNNYHKINYNSQRQKKEFLTFR